MKNPSEEQRVNKEYENMLSEMLSAGIFQHGGLDKTTLNN
jgi:hypothetical protein